LVANRNGAFKTWRPGMIGVIRPEYSHRIHSLLNGPSFSLWLRGRNLHPIHLRGSGWAKQKQTHRAANTVLQSDGSKHAPSTEST
jgi:hypothetical protein